MTQRRPVAPRAALLRWPQPSEAAAVTRWGGCPRRSPHCGRSASRCLPRRSQPRSRRRAGAPCRCRHRLQLRRRRRRRHFDLHPRRLPRCSPAAARAIRARTVASVWKKPVRSIGVSARQALRATIVKTTRAQVRMIRSRTTRQTTDATHVPTTCLTGMRFRATTGWLVAWFSALTAAASRPQAPVRDQQEVGTAALRPEALVPKRYWRRILATLRLRALRSAWRRLTAPRVRAMRAAVRGRAST
jgi:hypothetical protein